MVEMILFGAFYTPVRSTIDHPVRSMCIAVPAEVLEIKEGNIGVVDYGELKQEVRLDLVEVKVGEFVLVHVGFAIQKLSREEGLETREIFRQLHEALKEELPDTG
jgi:hydrogenase expression/formation protein HypC